jgi:hypothetical protein
MTEFAIRLFGDEGVADDREVVRPASGAGADPNDKPALDRRLDQALAETFPASDPVAIVISV